MLIFLSVILVWAVCLVVGLIFLPASAFTFLSGILLLMLPRPRTGLDYGRLHRAAASVIIVGTALLLSSVLSAGFSHEPALQAGLAAPCGGISAVVAHLPLMHPSPACRLIQKGIGSDAGFGLFLEIGFLVNLAWIRLKNFRLRPSRSELASGVNESLSLFFVGNFLLSVLAYAIDKLVSLPAHWPQLTIGYGLIVLIFMSTIVFSYLTVQGNLFPQSERSGKFG